MSTATTDDGNNKQHSSSNLTNTLYSNAYIVASLRLQIQELEKKEKATLEKLKEEHAQLVNFQKKLAQAGSHLKTLAQENANLTKSLAEEKKQKENTVKEKTELETMRHDENTTWSTKVQELENELKSSKEGHQKEIKQLVDILETTAKSINQEEEDTTTRYSVPDVSTSTLLDNYIKSVQKRLAKSADVAAKASPAKGKKSMLYY
jgi:chromosome segregation ATPase